MQAGQRFADRFEIDKLIGEGGVGRVYRATDSRSGAAVAIKCLRKEYAANTRVRRRFMREARAIGRLSHSNIVEIYDYGEHENTPYICMEFIDGTPMSELRDEVIAVPRLLGLVDQLLAALAYTHARGIIHRDVKPENVIIVFPAAEGLNAMVKLVDFGFARVDDDIDPRQTQGQGKSQAFGTPQYMAPEQAMGGKGKGAVGPATDLYAVGVLLFEFLAGHPPFTGAHGMAVALKHLMEEVPALKPRPGIKMPVGLEAVVRRVMSKEPHKRYRSAADMRRAIAVYHKPDAIIATPAPGKVSDAAAHIARVAVEAAMQASAGPAISTNDTVPMDPAEHLLAVATENPAHELPPVGREKELMWLWQRVRVVCDERAGRVVALGADQGMGKTHLLQFLRDQVAEGGWMTCLGGTHGLSGSLEELLEDPPADPVEAEAHIAAHLERWARISEVPVDATTAGALAAFLRPSDSVVLQSVRGAVLFDRICDVFALVARERPVLMLLEGIGSQETAEDTAFVAHLAKRLRTAPFPVLLVATYGLVEGLAPAGVQACLRVLEEVGLPVVEGMSLAPLSANDVTKLLRAKTPLALDVADAIAQRTHGNPFFAEELLLLLQQIGEVVDIADECVFSPHADPSRWPKTLSDSLLSRSRGTVERLRDGQFAGEILEHAAVLGSEFDYGLLVDFLERIFGDGRRVERVVESLLQANILEESSNLQLDRLHFAHVLLRGALVKTLAARVDVTSLHRKAGQALVAYYAHSSSRYADAIGRQFEAGGLPGDAARYYVIAGGYARDEGRSVDALELFEAADRLFSRIPGQETRGFRASLWIDLGELELERGNENRAQKLAARVHKWARSTDNSVHEGRSLLLISDLYRKTGRLGEATKGYERAAQAFERGGSEKGTARARLGQAMCERSRGRLDEAKALFARARVAMEAVSDDLGAGRAWQGLGETSLRLGDYQGARTSLACGRTAYTRGGFIRDAAYIAWMLGETHARLGDVDRAVDAFDAARRDYAAVGERAGLARCERGLARLYADQEDPRRAIGHYRAAVSTLEAIGAYERAANTYEELGQTALLIEDYREAETAFRRSLAILDDGVDPTREAILRTSLALAAAKRGDHAAADAELGRVLAQDLPTLTDDEVARLFEAVAEANAYAGRRGRGPQLLDRAAAILLGLGNSQSSARLRARRAELWGRT